MNKGFFSQLFVMFFVAILSVSLIGLLFGSGAQQYSSLFSLGSSGVSFVTIFQLLLYSTVISLLKIVLFSERIFRKVMMKWRAALLVFGAFITGIIFILFFHWFPYDYLPAWVGFLVSFTTGFAISLTIVLIKSRIDNRKYDTLLSRYKEEKSREVK